MYGSSFINPYMYNTAGISTMGRMGLGKGLFSNLFKNFSLSGFLSGTSKTLNVINQAIPIYYQVKPIFSNAKTMFKVMSAVKSNDSSKNNNTNLNNSNNVQKNSTNNSERPTFFI